MSEKIKNLSPQQHQAALLLAEGRAGREVAEALEVAPETISRWKQLPEFEVVINGCLVEARDAARLKLRTLASRAVAVFEELLCNQQLDPKVRLTAATQLLKLLDVSELFDAHEPLGPLDPAAVRSKRATEALFARLEEL